MEIKQAIKHCLVSNFKNTQLYFLGKVLVVEGERSVNGINYYDFHSRNAMYSEKTRRKW